MTCVRCHHRRRQFDRQLPCPIRQDHPDVFLRKPRREAEGQSLFGTRQRTRKTRIASRVPTRGRQCASDPSERSVIGADGIETKKPASLVAAILSWLPLGESAASRTDRKQGGMQCPRCQQDNPVAEAMRRAFVLRPGPGSVLGRAVASKVSQELSVRETHRGVTDMPPLCVGRRYLRHACPIALRSGIEAR